MAGGVSTINTVLKSGATSSVLTQLVRIKSYPKLGGEPEMLETTDLEDIAQTFVPGVQSVEAMTFTANYKKEDHQKILTSAGKEQVYELEFGASGADGVFSWKGQHHVSVNEGEVNGVREMTISITPSTEIKPEKASTAFPAV